MFSLMQLFLCPFHDNRPRDLVDITDYQTQGVVYVLKYECPECGFRAEFNNETR